MSGVVANVVRRAVNVHEEELTPLIWSVAYYFFVLSAYYVIRPIRDEMGVAGGVDNLAWLFTGTLIGVLLVHPLYTALVSKLSRRRFVPLTYRFFILSLIGFFLLFRLADATESVWVGRTFFIWVSIFNLFVVSVFWSFMTDVYRTGQSKRLFGVLAVGGTMGAILGASITSFLVELMGPINLLLVSGLLLEIAARASNILGRHEERLASVALEDAGQEEMAAEPDTGGAGSEGGSAAGSSSREEEARSHDTDVIGGGVLEGIGHVVRSPYLLGIAAFMLLYTIASTFLYFQQADVVVRAFGDDPSGRTRLFANIDLAVNLLTLITQIFLTGRLMRWLGVGVSLALLPLISVIGFGMLATAPILAVIVVFQVLRRASNYAVARPAREVLYTVLPRTDKYKAKNFNDTFVYRTGDQVGAWSYHGLAALGLGLSSLALLMVPVSVVWLLLALWLGMRQRKMREREAEGLPAEEEVAQQPSRV